ncbi:MAG: RluA family pseudouridine synthase [Myxococcales bacterium]
MPEAQLHHGDRVEVTLSAPPAARLTRESVLHLDEVVLAVDKPAGVAAQEDLAGGPALPDLCSALLREMGEREEALLVHRLDRGTTGVTVLARTREAQAALLREFREHRARKQYRALVAPGPGEDAGAVETPVAGRAARTLWRVVERYPGAASIEASPETGRTHQIRIHLAGLGCPLLGDKAHGGKTFVAHPSGKRHEVDRPMLHALSLALRHPRGGELRVEAPPPGDFAAVQAFLRASR